MTASRWAVTLAGLLSLMALSLSPLKAHTPNAVSLRLHTSTTGSYLEVIAPRAGVESAFQKRFATEEKVPLDSVEGKERIVQYVKDTVHLSTPQGSITLGKGLIRVTSHEVTLKLRVKGAEGDIFPLALNAPCLAENPGELVTFRLISGREQTRVLLTEANTFSATLDRGAEGTIQVLSPSPTKEAAPSSGP